MKEKELKKVNGFIGLFLAFVFLGVAVFCFSKIQNEDGSSINVSMLVVAIICVLCFILTVSGLCIIQPNQSRVFTFFGQYVGVIKEQGYWFTFPLLVSKKVSLRVINFPTPLLKVNDNDGNPIDVGAIVVYKVKDSTKAVFDVENYNEFIKTQSETGLRHIASQYPYDCYEDETKISLRKHSDEIGNELTKDLQTRLDIAGIEVIEARIMHLAYSSEIASAMLQRQQAQAILSARKIIVDGAVYMVKSAIDQLASEGVVNLDEDKKATMVNNLLVTIVSEKGNQPIINTGSIQ